MRVCALLKITIHSDQLAYVRQQWLSANNMMVSEYCYCTAYDVFSQCQLWLCFQILPLQLCADVLHFVVRPPLSQYTTEKTVIPKALLLVWHHSPCLQPSCLLPCKVLVLETPLNDCHIQRLSLHFKVREQVETVLPN
jgi:hypothetical protein